MLRGESVFSLQMWDVVQFCQISGGECYYPYIYIYIYIYKHFDICKKIAFMKSCYTNIFCCYSKKKKKTYFVCV